MIYTNLLHYFAKGPFEPAYLGDADNCATEWWKNLLYINNIFSSKEDMVSNTSSTYVIITAKTTSTL